MHEAGASQYDSRGPYIKQFIDECTESSGDKPVDLLPLTITPSDLLYCGSRALNMCSGRQGRCVSHASAGRHPPSYASSRCRHRGELSPHGRGLLCRPASVALNMASTRV